MKPEISIIVPVHNGEKTLSSCLSSLMALDYPKEDLEIIVVDNNSTDDTKDIIQRYPVRYIFESQRGRARARNAGIKQARGKYIAFTDADCVVDKNWLKELIKGFDSDDIVACGGKILAKETKNWIERYIEETGMLAQEGTRNDDIERNIYRIVTANAIFKRDIFDKLGYFDEKLITGEDTEMGCRISLYGYQIKYIPQAVVYHQHIKSLKKFCLWNFDFGHASYIYYRKYQVIFNFPIRWVGLLQFMFILLRRYQVILWKFIKGFASPKQMILDLLSQTFYIGGEIIGCLKDILNKMAMPMVTPNPDLKRTIGINYNGSKWFINNVIFGVPEGEIILLYRSDKNIYYRLQDTASFIWKSLLEDRLLSEIADKMVQKYGVSLEQAEKDVTEFLIQLEKEEIIFKG